MGNIPTWRDVAAPDFNTALGAYGVAGRNITEAGSALSKGLGDFQTDAQNTAAAQLAAAAAKYPDQKSLEAALQSGALMGNVSNPGYLTADAYKIPDNRASTLLTQATGQQALDHSTKMAPLLETGQDLSNKSTAASTANTNLDNQYKAKTLDDRVAYQHGSVEGQSEDLKEKKQNFADNQAKTAVDVNGTKWSSIAAQGTTDPNTAIANLNALKLKEDAEAKASGRESELDQNTYADALAKIQRQVSLGNPAGSNGSSGGAPALPNPATQELSKAAGAGVAPGSTSAAANAVLSSIPYSETRKYVANVIAADGGDNSPNAVWKRMIGQESGGHQFNKDGTTLTSNKGAGGAAQVLKSTGPEAAKLAGVPWSEDRWANDKDYNLKLGRAYFDNLVKHYGGDTRQAAAAYNAGQGAVDSWHLAEQHNDLNSQAYGAIAGANTALAQSAAQGIQGSYRDTQVSKDSLGVVTKNLVESDPRFKDADPTAVADQISRLITNSQTKDGTATLTPATAASLLSRYGGRQHWYQGLPFTNREIAINDQDGLDKALSDIKTGTTQANVSKDNGTAVATAQLQTAQGVAEDAFNQYTNLRKLVEENGRSDLKPAMEKALDKYKSTKVALQAQIEAHPLASAKHDQSAAALAKAAAQNANLSAPSTNNGASAALNAATQPSPSLADRINSITPSVSVRDRIKKYNATPIDQRPTLRDTLHKAFGTNN